MIRDVLSLKQNRLLALLPNDEAERIHAKLEPITLDRDDTLVGPGQPISHVYFPLGSVACQVGVLESGRTIEVATIGNDGMVGISAYFGVLSGTFQNTCQIPVAALRMRITDFRDAVECMEPFRDILGRYMLALTPQIAQSAARNVAHSINDRTARWLLMTHDRVGRDEFQLTHAYLGGMLGVRRESVTFVAGSLHEAGLITYHRGTITILDREGLEAASCECYALVRDEYERLLGRSADRRPSTV